MATRWGFASAGRIAHDFANALSTLSKSEHRIVSITDRFGDLAKEFASKNDIPKVHASYYDLASDPNVDVVHVGVINPYHLEVAKIMLDSGKPVICEKPLAMNFHEARQLVDLAKSNKVFFLEGVWSRFFPAYELLRKEIKNGALGSLKHIFVRFGSPISDLDRIKTKSLGGGSILDIGVYVLQLVVALFGPEYPVSIAAKGTLNSDGVDASMSAVLQYEDGRMATVTTNIDVQMPNDAVIVGTGGTALIHSPFWCPTDMKIKDKHYNFPLPVSDKHFNFINCIGLSYEAQEIRRCLKEGLLESPQMTHEESLVIAKLETELRKQLGVVYEADLRK